MGCRMPGEHEVKHFVGVNHSMTLRITNGYYGVYSSFRLSRTYRQEHSKMLHDHYGWPSPRRFDQSCQLPPGQDYETKWQDVNLRDAGYTSIFITTTNAPVGLRISGEISGGNSVKLFLSAHCEAAIHEDMEIPYTAYIVGNAIDRLIDGYIFDKTPLKDVIAEGVIHITAGPLE